MSRGPEYSINPESDQQVLKGLELKLEELKKYVGGPDDDNFSDLTRLQKDLRALAYSTDHESGQVFEEAKPLFEDAITRFHELRDKLENKSSFKKAA